MKKKFVVLGLIAFLSVSGISGLVAYNNHVEAKELKIAEQEKKAEAERIAKEKEKQEKIAKEKAEQERLAKEKAEKEEQERIAAEKAKQEQAEAERLAEEKRIAELKKEADKQMSEGKIDYSDRGNTPPVKSSNNTIKTSVQSNQSSSTSSKVTTSTSKSNTSAKPNTSTKSSTTPKASTSTKSSGSSEGGTDWDSIGEFAENQQLNQVSSGEIDPNGNTWTYSESKK